MRAARFVSKANRAEHAPFSAGASSVGTRSATTGHSVSARLPLRA